MLRGGVTPARAHSDDKEPGHQDVVSDTSKSRQRPRPGQPCLLPRHPCPPVSTPSSWTFTNQRQVHTQPSTTPDCPQTLTWHLPMSGQLTLKNKSHKVGTVWVPVLELGKLRLRKSVWPTSKITAIRLIHHSTSIAGASRTLIANMGAHLLAVDLGDVNLPPSAQVHSSVKWKKQ